MRHFYPSREDLSVKVLVNAVTYKRKCQETYLPVGSVPTLFCFGIQPNRLDVHS
jgi:hypothetical protein